VAAAFLSGKGRQLGPFSDFETISATRCGQAGRQRPDGQDSTPDPTGRTGADLLEGVDALMAGPAAPSRPPTTFAAIGACSPRGRDRAWLIPSYGLPTLEGTRSTSGPPPARPAPPRRRSRVTAQVVAGDFFIRPIPGWPRPPCSSPRHPPLFSGHNLELLRRIRAWCRTAPPLAAMVTDATHTQPPMAALVP